MSEYIQKIRTAEGDKQIDYNALANLPDLGNYSNTMKAQARGKVVRVDDVSPVEHIVKVNVSGDVGLSTTTVTACGKNLIDHELMPEEATSDGVTVTRDGDTITLNGTLATARNFLNTAFAIYSGTGESYTLSYKHISGTVTGTAHICIGVANSIEEARQSWIALTLENKDAARTYQPIGSYIKDIWFYCLAGVTFDNFTIKIQFEKGTTPTAYEPYKGETYTVNADGSCEIASVSPAMTLFTDTASTTIECEYNRDINALIKAVPLIDRITGTPYYLYVSGGKLYIEEREG